MPGSEPTVKEEPLERTDWFWGSEQGYCDFIAPAGDDLRRGEGPFYRLLKRAFDIVAALGGLALVLPLFPFIVALIKLETPGPVFFRQRRVGRRGRMFDCFKFRSMAVDAEARKAALSHLNEATGAAFKIKDDPRITGVGRFLRRSSLDEFPQLLNVLLGDMTIVGPRPQIPSEVEDYRPQQAQRLLVRPGLTCLWQVSGRSHLDFAEWMELDREYVRTRGLARDISILLRTLPAVIERKGAY
jgi:lipopolysaccharide/colanic/teichoic acid biosynthesis glycosyltransferase